MDRLRAFALGRRVMNHTLLRFEFGGGGGAFCAVGVLGFYFEAVGAFVGGPGECVACRFPVAVVDSREIGFEVGGHRFERDLERASVLGCCQREVGLVDGEVGVGGGVFGVLALVPPGVVAELVL